MNVVGVDLSLTSTGICWDTHKTTTVGYSLPADAPEADQLQRMRSIAAVLMGYIDPRPASAPGQRADLVAIEDLIPGIKGASYAQTVGLHYVVRHTLAANEIPYVLVHNSAVKRYATGKGGGAGTDKRAIAIAIIDRCGVRHDTDDETDAWILRAMTLDHYGHPVLAKPMPKTHRAALEKIPWPELETANR